MLGMSDVWQCGMAKPTDGGSGAPVVAIWAGRSAREQRRVLRQVNDLYDTACEGPDGSAASGSSDGTTSTRSARPAVTLRYITGGRWIAFVDINARIEPIANVLDGQVEVKRCGADSLKGS
jgi:hypothetical protein